MMILAMFLVINQIHLWQIHEINGFLQTTASVVIMMSGFSIAINTLVVCAIAIKNRLVTSTPVVALLMGIQSLIFTTGSF